MNFIWRFMLTWFFTAREKEPDMFKYTSRSFYVLPTDVDLMLHINNGRYLSFMDIARLDYMLKRGFFYIFKKNKVFPVVASEMIRFRRSIKLFQKFTITTKVLTWDKKFFYIGQYFMRQEKIYAVAAVKTCFIRGKTILSTDEILTLINIKEEAPPFPAWLTTWQSAEEDFDPSKGTTFGSSVD